MMITAQYEALHHFLADRIADLGPAAANDPFAYAVNAQLVIHSDLLLHRDHPALSPRDAAFIDGLGLALRHAAARFHTHPDYRPVWTPPRVEARHLLDADYR
ncbi:hypothetical protein [Streptomyces sp. NRRL B-1347]|uniref:hypothetical protein n=1 Tax=Streptomyces sp. NRRL B-1347 TaxID=1476877 RepID=UPI0004C9C121|nr:hypothetical protein [Streptomyces sp. NRRL B-1347]